MTSRRFMPFRSVRLFEPDHRDRRSARRLPDHRRRARATVRGSSAADHRHPL